MKQWRSWSLFTLLAGCTAFEGVEPGGAPAGGGPGSGGEGGGPEETCLAKSPSCFLPELEAVRLCARVAACPSLATAIVRATAIPIAELDESGARIGFNFSSCVDWLTGPLEAAHPGFAAVRDVLNDVISTSSCEKAEGFLATAPLPIDLGGCDEETCATFGLSCGDEGCADSGAPPVCDIPFATACNGSAVTSCALPRVDGMWLEAHIDCSQAGLECAAAGSRCAVAQAGCDQLGDSNSCQSDHEIRLCLHGAALDFDCATVGLSCVGADLPNGISGRCQ